MAWLADTLFYGLEPCVDGMKLSAREAKATAVQLSRVEVITCAGFPAPEKDLISLHNSLKYRKLSPNWSYSDNHRHSLSQVSDKLDTGERFLNRVMAACLALAAPENHRRPSGSERQQSAMPSGPVGRPDGYEANPA
jgi:hypothetical protein